MGETQENNIQQTSEQDLWQEEAAMMHIFSRNRKNNLRTLLSLFKGHYGALVGSIFFFIIKHSPTWVLPIVTANIINAVTDHNGNITKILILNTILMIAFLVQNIPTNYIHTWLYAKTVRTVEKELREALVCKLQQLSITYHKEMQSGRLQSKIMRDVEHGEKIKKYNLPYLLRKNSHYINDIFGDNEERIWAITSQGISYYEYEKDSLQIFLRHNQPVKASIITTEGSKLLIPVTDTLLVYEKELKHSKAIPLKTTGIHIIKMEPFDSTHYLIINNAWEIKLLNKHTGEITDSPFGESSNA